MPDFTTIRNLVHSRFCEVFGEPNTHNGNGHAWTLRPDGVFALDIHVRLSSIRSEPAVWIFDPNARDHDVCWRIIKSEADLKKVIKHLQHRMELAAKRKPTVSVKRATRR